MKCKNCGGMYKARQLKCPYCDTENFLGRVWMQERSAAELEYERTRREMGKFAPVYAANRVLNRIIVLVITAWLLVSCIVLVCCGIWEICLNVRTSLGRGTMEETMAEYYREGEWGKLDAYMEKNELYDSEKNYGYSQAALLAYSYDEYLNNKYTFLELDEEEKQEDDFYLRYALSRSLDCYCLRQGVYHELDPMNEEMYRSFQQEILSFWVGTLGLRSDEIELMVNKEYLGSDELDGILAAVKERKAWQ